VHHAREHRWIDGQVGLQVDLGRDGASLPLIFAPRVVQSHLRVREVVWLAVVFLRLVELVPAVLMATVIIQPGSELAVVFGGANRLLRVEHLVLLAVIVHR